MTSNSKNHCLLSLAEAIAFVAGPSGSSHSQTADVIIELQPTSPPAVRDVRWRRVGPALTALHEQYTAHRAASIQPFAPGIPYLRVADDMVVIDTAADGDVAELEAALAKLGAVDVVAFKWVVSARLPLAAIPKLADIQQLRFARPARMLTNVGSVTSQGDVATNADDARANFGVDGSGVMIGIISDSLDCGAGTPGNYATDIATLDLPAGIEVLADAPCGTDEGRAMAQLAFDVAPGANFTFHTAVGGQAAFALGIQELAGCPMGSEPGCVPAADPADAIVNDAIYLAEPMFQDGIVAQAVDQVFQHYTPYFSAAGDRGRASYEGFVESSGISPLGSPFPPGDALDIDPGAGVDIFQQVALPAGSTTFVVNWDERSFSASGPPGSTNEVDVCIYPDPPPGAGPFGCATAFNFGGDPIEVFELVTGAPVVVNFAFIQEVDAGGPTPQVLKWVAFDDADPIDPFGFTEASTLYGSGNARDAMAVGAVNYPDTPPFGTAPALLADYSSAGDTVIFWGTKGTANSPPETRFQPMFTAPDGTNNTFLGIDTDMDGFPNLSGTSAAASHATGLGALVLEASPNLSPSGLRSILKGSALDMGPEGFDFDSGVGYLDSNTAVGAVSSGSSCNCESATPNCPSDIIFGDKPNEPAPRGRSMWWCTHASPRPSNVATTATSKPSPP